MEDLIPTITAIQSASVLGSIAMHKNKFTIISILIKKNVQYPFVFVRL